MDLSTFRDSVRVALDDVSESSYSNELILDGIVAGLSAIAKWLPNHKVLSMIADGNSEIALSEAVHKVTGIVNTTVDYVYDKFRLDPGYQYTGREVTWLEMSSGSIYFSPEAPTADDAMTVFVDGYWDAPAEDTDVMSVPDKAIHALRLYTMAYCLNPSMVGGASLDRFDTKVDSGNPEHNPIEKASRYLLALFEAEVSRIGVYQ